MAVENGEWIIRGLRWNAPLRIRSTAPDRSRNRSAVRCERLPTATEAALHALPG